MRPKCWRASATRGSCRSMTSGTPKRGLTTSPSWSTVKVSPRDCEAARCHGRRHWRWPRDSVWLLPALTPSGSCTATSSRPTFCSLSTARSRSAISGWPVWPREPRRRRLPRSRAPRATCLPSRLGEGPRAPPQTSIAPASSCTRCLPATRLSSTGRWSSWGCATSKTSRLRFRPRSRRGCARWWIELWPRLRLSATATERRWHSRWAMSARLGRLTCAGERIR